MIKNNTTICGLDVSSLKEFSRKKVVKVCDDCNKELIVNYSDLNKSRKRNNSDGKDRCKDCARALYTGELNPSKRQEVREKISKAHLGKSKNIQLHNLQFKKLSNAGYYLIYDENKKKYIEEHRVLVQNAIGRELLQIEKIHHVDGNKINNNLKNLYLCENESVHQKIHNNLESVSFELVKKGLVVFNKDNGSYEISKDFFISEQSMGFENISIKQKKNICASRLDADTSTEIIKGIIRPNPLIASNMSTVINGDFYKKLYSLGSFGFLQRAQSEESYLQEVLDVSLNCEWVGAAIGVTKYDRELCDKLINNGANVILIDVAHGYSDIVMNLGREIKKQYPHIKLVIGNTVNEEMMYEISDFADAVKVGIAQGFACETKNTAGCTEKQFSALLKFKELSKQLGIPVISDGGTREAADVVKAIAAGANSVMMGKIFAACPESAGPVVDGKKLYAGMASEWVQKNWKGGLKPGTCSEGGVRMLDISEPVEKVIEHFTGALRSGITYSGANSILTLQENVEFIKIS